MDVMEYFSVKDVAIKSNWFDDKSNFLYKRMGKEEGLNFYLQLFRFRIHSVLDSDVESRNTHFFKFTIGEMLPYLRVNQKRKPRYGDVVKHLQVMSDVKVLGEFNVDVDELKGLKSEKDVLIKCKAIDVPAYSEKGKYIDKYIMFPLSITDYIYKRGYTSKTIAMYMFMLKFANNVNNAYFVSRDNVKKLLGIGSDTIKELYIGLNELHLAATYENRNSDGSVRNHHIVNKVNKSHADKFYQIHKDTIDKFVEGSISLSEDDIDNMAWDDPVQYENII